MNLGSFEFCVTRYFCFGAGQFTIARREHEQLAALLSRNEELFGTLDRDCGYRALVKLGRDVADDEVLLRALDLVQFEGEDGVGAQVFEQVLRDLDGNLDSRQSVIH